MRVDKIGINTRVNINNKNQNDSNKIKSNLQTKKRYGFKPISKQSISCFFGYERNKKQTRI